MMMCNDHSSLDGRPDAGLHAQQLLDDDDVVHVVKQQLLLDLALAAPSAIPRSRRAAACVAALAIDETIISSKIKPQLAKQDLVMKRLRQEGMPHQEALLKCSRAFQDYIGEICMAAILARDKRAVQLVLERGGEAVHALRVLGALDPPWRVWRRGDSAERLAHEFGDNLDQTRPNREYSMRSRIVRVETAAGYSKSRLRPRDLASPAVNHVISASDVARLRSGECLVLDPNPALLSASGFAAAMADLMGVVNRKGVAESHNPCNKGSFHGMLPVNPSSGAAEGLGPSTCELLRKLAALPALIERHGWPRPLALPSMVQLGFYPGGSGAAYRPHLDLWASEVNNRRELTFLVYCNVGWDAEKHGGLAPPSGSEPSGREHRRCRAHRRPCCRLRVWQTDARSARGVHGRRPARSHTVGRV